jgi:hypothetical protein
LTIPSAGADVSFSGSAQSPEERLSLWYRQPAKAWTEALPIGNGRLGAMIFGERIRDKKRATTRRGKYIGGQPVLGLDMSAQPGPTAK